jgi:hypothetical protein
MTAANLLNAPGCANEMGCAALRPSMPTIPPLPRSLRTATWRGSKAPPSTGASRPAIRTHRRRDSSDCPPPAYGSVPSACWTCE